MNDTKTNTSFSTPSFSTPSFSPPPFSYPLSLFTPSISDVLHTAILHTTLFPPSFPKPWFSRLALWPRSHRIGKCLLSNPADQIISSELVNAAGVDTVACCIPADGDMIDDKYTESLSLVVRFFVSGRVVEVRRAPRPPEARSL